MTDEELIEWFSTCGTFATQSLKPEPTADEILADCKRFSEEIEFTAPPVDFVDGLHEYVTRMNDELLKSVMIPSLYGWTTSATAIAAISGCGGCQSVACLDCYPLPPPANYLNDRLHPSLKQTDKLCEHYGLSPCQTRNKADYDYGKFTCESCGWEWRRASDGKWVCMPHINGITHCASCGCESAGAKHHHRNLCYSCTERGR